MDTDRDPVGSRNPGFLSPPTSSFVQYLATAAPELLPGRRTLPPGSDTGDIPHGTTIIAAVYDGGVVMAGDRRATAGNMIAVRHVDKVHAADEYTAIGFAGSAGFGAEIVRLYQVELEHYEKIEGTPLSAEGKANRLSMLVRNHLGLAMQGLAVVPLLATFDTEAGKGRIYSYDPTGGRTEERGFHGIGSGSLFARGALKKLYRPEAGRDEIAAACLQALYDAADDDSATGGPDVTRQIYPLIAYVDDSGFTMLPEHEVAGLVDRMLSGRMEKPDGPTAPVFNEAAGDAGREGSDAR